MMNSHRSFLLLLHYTEPQAEQPLKDCYRTIDKQLYTFLKSVSVKTTLYTLWVDQPIQYVTFVNHEVFCFLFFLFNEGKIKVLA